MKPEFYISELDPYFAFFKKNSAAVVYSTQQKIPHHRHKVFFELGYVKQGRAEHTLNGETTTIRQGDYFIMDPASSHGYISDDNAEIVNLIFHPKYIDASLAECTKLSELVTHFSISYLPQNIGRIHWQIFHDANGEILGLIDRIAKELHEGKNGNRAIVRSYIIILLVTVMRHIGDAEERHSLLVRDILSVIEQQYMDPLSLTKIAERLNYSTGHLSRLFSAEMGQSFCEYLQNYRLEIATHRLANTTLPVYEIAASVGYNDVRFFYQLFKRTYHTTPVGYRKRLMTSRLE